MLRSRNPFAWPAGCAAMVLLFAWLAPALAGGGPVPDFTPHGTQPGLLVQLEGATSCESCHSNSDVPESTFLPHSTWSGSMMANAARDPIFWAALDVAERDVPGVGDWCLRCHSPQGWLGGRVRKDGNSGVVNGTNGCLLTGNHIAFDSDENDYAGVTCHMCHRMTALGPSGQVSPQFGTGNYWVDDSLSCDGYFGPCRQGPYLYAPNSQLEPPHGWRYSRFTTGSEQCGTCHDVSSPQVAGVPLRTLKVPGLGDTGRAFPAERTFTEWKQSRFGDVVFRDSFEDDAIAALAGSGNTDCQDCHMRQATAPQARACMNNPSGSRAGNLAVHEFVGGGVWPLRMLKALYGGPSGLDREAAFDRTIAWSLDLLQNRSATLAVTLDPWAGAPAPLIARVRVTNLSGHKLPTGYGEGRRMWIEFVARDSNNNVVFSSGGWNPSTGVLASDPQLKVYEVKQGIWNAGTSTCETTNGNGAEQFHFVLNDCIAKDNRIPPEGFRLYSSADPQGLEIRPVAYAYPQTAPGSGILVNHDDTTYTLAIPPGTPTPVTVTATLQYQTASREYIEFLRNEAVENGQLSENAMCARTPGWTVGPADQTRAQFLYDQWSDPKLGRSPPVPMRAATAATP